MQEWKKKEDDPIDKAFKALRKLDRDAWNAAIDAAINVVAENQSKSVQPIIEQIFALKRNS